MKPVFIGLGIVVAIFIILFLVIGQYPILRNGVEIANATNADLAGNFTGFSGAVRSYFWLPMVIVIGWIIYALWSYLRKSGTN